LIESRAVAVITYRDEWGLPRGDENGATHTHTADTHIHVHMSGTKGGGTRRRRGADLSIRGVVSSQFGETGIQFPGSRIEKGERGTLNTPLSGRYLNPPADTPTRPDTRLDPPCTRLRISGRHWGKRKKEEDRTTADAVQYNDQSLEEKGEEGGEGKPRGQCGLISRFPRSCRAAA